MQHCHDPRLCDRNLQNAKTRAIKNIKEYDILYLKINKSNRVKLNLKLKK